MIGTLVSDEAITNSFERDKDPPYRGAEFLDGVRIDKVLTTHVDQWEFEAGRNS